MDHHEIVQQIQNRVSSEKGNLTFSTGVPSNTLRQRTKKGLDLSSLNRILEWGPDYVRVEPRITFQTLCQETLKRKLIPPVVPEFTSITVGGAVAGAALESSSHRYGQVSDCCLEYEVILGNSELVYASPEENNDLFYGLSGSYGTLGIITAIKLRLIKAKDFVHITSHPLKNSDLLSFLKSPHGDDFVEGFVLNAEEGVALTGRMTHQNKYPLFQQNRYWSPWYIEAITKKRGQEWCMPLKDYMFRLDKGAFWMGKYALSIPTLLRLLLRLGVPPLTRSKLFPSPLFRFLFGWALNSQRLYGIWHRIPKEISENLFFIHDFYTPFPVAEKLFSLFIEKTQIFPIWLCPIKGTKTPQLFAPHFGNPWLLNIGLYGIPNSPLSVRELSSELENEIALFGGRKMLYSYTYYERERFSKIYDETNYQALRKKYFADQAFPHIYNKVII